MVFCRRHADVFFESLREQTRDSKPLRAWMKETVRRSDEANRSLDSQNRSERSGARRDELFELASRVPPKHSVVYFVECEGLVNIGITQNLRKRVEEISGGSAMIEGMTIGPVRLLGSISGGPDEERVLHKRFRHLSAGGEWFRLNGELESYIQEAVR